MYGLAVGEVEVAVLVEVADVADASSSRGRCAPRPSSRGRCGTRSSRPPSEPDRARPRRPASSLPSSSRMCSVPSSARPTGARVREPLLGVDRGEQVALGAGVVLVDDRPPPLDHLRLDRRRARRGGVDDGAQRRQVEARALLLGQLEQADEHRRHHLHVRHAVALDQLQSPSRVEALHDDGRAAEAVHAHREAQRRGVVQRRRARGRPCPSPKPYRRCEERGRSPGGVPIGASGSPTSTPLGRPVVPDE